MYISAQQISLLNSKIQRDHIISLSYSIKNINNWKKLLSQLLIKFYILNSIKQSNQNKILPPL